LTIWATHSFILDNRQVLLLKRARGLFGEGRWFVPGGKVAVDEKPENCVVRETLEETGLYIKNPKQIGMVHFYKDSRRDVPEWSSHVFLSREFSRTLTEGREGRLKWFNVDNLPFHEMWEDDPFWVGHVFDERPFEARFYYKGDFEKLVDRSIVQL
jgi:8-oxo-dGTP diphosphatase